MLHQVIRGEDVDILMEPSSSAPQEPEAEDSLKLKLKYAMCIASLSMPFNMLYVSECPDEVREGTDRKLRLRRARLSPRRSHAMKANRRILFFDYQIEEYKWKCRRLQTLLASRLDSQTISFKIWCLDHQRDQHDRISTILARLKSQHRRSEALESP